MTNYLWLLSFSKWGQSLSKLKFWPYEGRINIPIYNEQYIRTLRIYLNIIFQIYISSTNHKFDFEKRFSEKEIWEKSLLLWDYYFYEVIISMIWNEWSWFGSSDKSFFHGFFRALRTFVPMSMSRWELVLKIRHLGGQRADIIREMDEGMKFGERWIKNGLYEHTQYLYKYQFIINIFI